MTTKLHVRRLPEVKISGIALSDLFFNASHPHFDMASHPVDDRAQLRKDADEFVENLGLKDYRPYGEPLGALLVDDFFNRL